MIATIGGMLSAEKVNIDNIVAPADAASGDALAVIKTNKPVPEQVVQNIAAAIQAKLAFALSF